ncbi:hypothetical protein DL546_005549 [Coniochaeta pulveracea]|uniref:non-reducing end alpha-L-arabinofuranosidase n=1 Tax=Coniochaeta pulveracea TaxID=177199 RepID=A0A420Y846_9PEZI|nr:hypothetical protein DL546_005549 [Coniochaeta pulveracea]
MFRALIVTAIYLAARAFAIELIVDTTSGNASSPLLYGIAFEDINHAGDGGIHGQLLQNNGLRPSNDRLAAWSPVGPVDLYASTDHPLSPAIKRSLEVAVPPGTKGQAGFKNTGYQGIPVNADTYLNRWYVKGVYRGPVTVTVYGPSGRAYGSRTMTMNVNSTDYVFFETTFVAAQSFEPIHEWKLTFDAILVAGRSLHFALVELFPVTYHNRDNGLRNDIATYVEHLSPSFLRFPGGNNMQGSYVGSRWKWNETIGPVALRPGRQGAWGYPNTESLGLMEYMQWCIDAHMEPILAVWAGLSLDGNVVPGEAAMPFIEDILNELEFLLGDTSTPYGALRAEYGRNEPYDLRYIEIGNEDNLSGGCRSYASRFKSIYSYVHALYPSLTLIASTDQTNCLPEMFPATAYVDAHRYLTPDQFVGLFDEFDHIPRYPDFGVIVGEYASMKDDAGYVKQWQDMKGSCGEAVYMIGLERNSDVVKMASYAPLLEHFGMTQWSVSTPIMTSSLSTVDLGPLLTFLFPPTAESDRFQLHSRLHHRQHVILGANHVLPKQRHNHPTCVILRRFRPCVLGGILKTPFRDEHRLLRQARQLR